MKKSEVRYHEIVSNKVASVYINKHYLNKDSVFTDGTDAICTRYYEYIGICVSNSRRFNNDWWNGDKRGDAVYNKSTGDIYTLNAIMDTLTIHVLECCLKYGFYCCMFEPTDMRRRKTYMKAIKHICKKCNLQYKYVITGDNEFLYYIW